MPSGRTNNFTESGRGLGHVTPTIFGSTVGYPSDSLASCLLFCLWLQMHCIAQNLDKEFFITFRDEAHLYSTLQWISFGIWTWFGSKKYFINTGCGTTTTVG